MLCQYIFRKYDENIKFEDGFWLWNGDRFSNDGLLCKSFPMYDIDIHGVIPTPIEAKRFGQLKAITVNYQIELNY